MQKFTLPKIETKSGSSLELSQKAQTEKNRPSINRPSRQKNKAKTTAERCQEQSQLLERSLKSLEQVISDINSQTLPEKILRIKKNMPILQNSENEILTRIKQTEQEIRKSKIYLEIKFESNKMKILDQIKQLEIDLKLLSQNMSFEEQHLQQQQNAYSKNLRNNQAKKSVDVARAEKKKLRDQIEQKKILIVEYKYSLNQLIKQRERIQKALPEKEKELEYLEQEQIQFQTIIKKWQEVERQTVKNQCNTNNLHNGDFSKSSTRKSTTHERNI